MPQFRPYAYQQTDTAASGPQSAPAALPTNLSDKAMRAHLTLRKWTAQRVDKQMSADTANAHGITRSDMVRATKKLIVPEAFDKVYKIQGAFRNWHLSMTLPWLDNGDRILPSALFSTYTAKAREFKAAHDDALTTALQQYPAFYNESRLVLGPAFNAAEYPTAYDLPAKFDAHVAFYDLVDPSDFRMPTSLSPADVDAIKQQAITDYADALRATTIDLIKRMWEPVKHMAETLPKYDPTGDKVQGKFHDTLVTNIEAIITIIPAMNITNDPQVTAFVKDLVKLVAYDAEQLRADPELRTNIAEEAAKITQAMQQFF